MSDTSGYDLTPPPVEPDSAPRNEYDTLISEAPQPTPANAGNEYDGLVVDFKAEKTQRLRATVLGAQTANPDNAAKAVDLSKKTGLPADLVERNLPRVEGDQKLNEYDVLLEKSPKLSAWLLADAMNARVAKDDYESLGVLERGWNEIKRQHYGTKAGVRAMGAEIGARTLVELEDAKQRQARGEYLSPWDKARLSQANQVQANSTGILTEGIAGISDNRAKGAALPMRPAMKALNESKTWGEAFEAIGQDPLGLIFDFTAQSLPQLAVGAGASIAGGPVAGITAGGLTSFGMEFVGGILENLQDAGIDTNDQEALKVALGDPAIMREVYRKSAVKAAVIATVDAASFGVAGVKMAPKALAKKPVQRESVNLVAQSLVQATAGGGSEALGSIAIGEEIKPSAVLGEVLGGLGTMPMEVATMRGAMREGQAAASMLDKAASADPGLKGLEAMIDLASKTGLAQRSPEKLAEFMASLADNAETVYVSVQAVMTYFQSLPPDEASAAMEAMGITGQMAEATATGGDVVIPLAQYVARIGPTKAHAAWRDDIRLDSAGMSTREAKTFTDETDARIEQLRRSVDDIAKSVSEDKAQAVFDDVMGQAKAAGVTEEAARAYARLYAERYRARGAQLGVDPFEAYQRSGVRIVGEMDGKTMAPPMAAADESPSTVAQSLKGLLPESQNVPADFKADPATLKAARRLSRGWGPEKELPPPQSLLDFVRKKGGLNIGSSEAGDVRASDLGRIPGLLQKKRAGTKVLKSSGQSVDFVAQAAAEAGYRFGPDTGYGSGVDVDAFLNALIEDAGGKQKHYPDDNDTATWRAQQDYLDQYTQWLAEDVQWNPKGRPALYQPDGSGMRRGSVSFGDGTSIIRLYEKRDLSTLLHESGHLWLEELRADALDPAVNEQVRKDWDTVGKWLGVTDGTLTRDQHEQFARGFEAYLMEGKSPSVELGDVFRRFKSWLITIYRTMRGLDVTLSDEVRQVMDRLVATEEAIEQASDELNARQLFGSADQAGMTEAEFGAYIRTVERARDKAETTLMAKAIEQVRRRRTEEWRDEEAKVRTEVEALARQAPDIAAEYWLRHGFTGRDEAIHEGPHRLDMALVEEMVGKEVANRLPRGVPPLTVKSGGLHPDAAAERLGFASGRELIEALAGIGDAQTALKAAEDKRSVLTSRVDPEVERLMAERHGDILNDGSIAEEAMAALHGEQRANVIAAEMRVLARKTGKQPTPYSILKNWAAATIASRSVREAATPAATQTYARQEAKAAKATERALIKGDFEEAFRRKQEQAINHALYIEAKKATESVETARKLMQRYADAPTLKAMDQTYLDQIHDLIERFDFSVASRKAVDRRVSLREWAEAQEAAGFDIAVPEELLDEAKRQHFTEMTVEQVRGLSDSVKQIAHLGRMKKTLLDGKKKREFDAVVDEAVNQIASMPQRGVDLSDRGKGKIAKALGGLGQTLRNADAALLKMETLFDWLDLKAPNGVFNRVVFRRMSEAQVAERDMQIDLNKRMMALYGKLPKGTLSKWREILTVPELPRNGEPSRLTKAELIAVALNTGNEGNHDKLLRGEKWDAEALKATLDKHLTTEEWQFVQGTWDLVESLWPQIAAMEKRLNGVEPPKIEAREVETPFGKLKGGYYPLVYDPKISLDVDVRGQASTDALFENLYTRATTPRGFTKTRTQGYARPIHLSLDVIPRHLTEVAHDLAFREAVMDADKFLGDKRISAAVEGALGREYYKQFRPWLQHIANEWAMDRRGLDGWEKFMRVARMNTTMVGMGFRLSTMMAQVGGYANSAEIIGSRWSASGLRTFVRNPAAARDFVYSRSGEMRHRANELERDIRDNMKKAAGETGVMADVRRFAFRGIALFDLGVTIPTWIGAYNKGLSEKMADGDAAAYADKVVRESQGAGGSKDLASVQRNSETMKLFTMFYSYFNAFYNRQRQLVRDARDASLTDVPDLLARSFWLIIAPALFGAYASGQGPGEDEDWGAWAARKSFFNLFMGVPFVRDIASGTERLAAGEYTRGAQFMPVTQMAETLFLKIPKEAVKLATGEDQSDTFIKTIANAAGYAMRLPTGQLGNTAQFLYDVADGTQDPRGLKEWIDGLAYGPKREK